MFLVFLFVKQLNPTGFFFFLFHIGRPDPSFDLDLFVCAEMLLSLFVFSCPRLFGSPEISHLSLSEVSLLLIRKKNPAQHLRSIVWPPSSRFLFSVCLFVCLLFLSLFFFNMAWIEKKAPGFLVFQFYFRPPDIRCLKLARNSPRHPFFFSAHPLSIRQIISSIRQKNKIWIPRDRRELRIPGTPQWAWIAFLWLCYALNHFSFQQGSYTMEKDLNKICQWWYFSFSSHVASFPVKSRTLRKRKWMKFSWNP